MEGEDEAPQTLLSKTNKQIKKRLRNIKAEQGSSHIGRSYSRQRWSYTQTGDGLQRGAGRGRSQGGKTGPVTTWGGETESNINRNHVHCKQRRGAAEKQETEQGVSDGARPLQKGLAGSPKKSTILYKLCGCVLIGCPVVKHSLQLQREWAGQNCHRLTVNTNPLLQLRCINCIS